MKSNPLPRIVSLLVAAIILAGFASTASAGPGPMMFAPVKSAKEAGKLKVGSQIAISCGNCNGVSISTVTSERTYLNGYKCAGCKKTFKTIMPGGGGRGTIGSFGYSDDAGHFAILTAHN